MSQLPSASDVAQLWGKHRHTIQAMCRKGELHAFKHGGTWFIDLDKSLQALSLKFGNQFAKEMAKGNGFRMGAKSSCSLKPKARAE